MPNDKTPGSDGLSVNFYKAFWHELKDDLCQVFNQCFENGELCPSMRRGIITLLPKQGKDNLYLKNWRPISLLNTDYKILAKVLAQMDYNGAVAACGLAGGFDLPTTVMPFILRGVKLLGIDSVSCPYEKRVKAWKRLVEVLPADFYEQACREITLEQAPECAEAITNGQVTGRIVIKL